MKYKLPVNIENNELPQDKYNKNKKNNYGYVSFMYLVSVIITLCSLLTIIILGK